MQAVENKREFIITKPIEFEEKKSELQVKISIDTVKATFKVTATVESKHVSYQDSEITGKVIEVVADMIEQGVFKAQETVIEIINENYSSEIKPNLFSRHTYDENIPI